MTPALWAIWLLHLGAAVGSAWLVRWSVRDRDFASGVLGGALLAYFVASVIALPAVFL